MAPPALLQTRNLQKCCYLHGRLFDKKLQLVENFPTCRFSSKSSSRSPVRYVPKQDRSPNQPPFEKRNDLAEHTRFNCPDPPTKSNKTRQICKEEVGSSYPQLWTQTFTGNDQLPEKGSPFLTGEGISKSSVEARRQSRSHHASPVEHEVDELPEILFFPNEEKISMVEEEPVEEVRASPRQNEDAGKTEAVKPQIHRDVQSFLLKARKAKMIAANNPSRVMDDEYSSDDDYNFATTVHDQETTDQLHRVHVSDSKQIAVSCTAEQEHAKNLAIQYLANRPYTAAELKKKLLSRHIAPHSANHAIKSVQNCGLQSDSAYSETFARARWNSGTWGPQRIKLGLRQKGVSDDIIQAVLNSVFCDDEGNNDCSDSGTMGISKPALEQLIRQAKKQWNRGKNVPTATKIRRMIHWLQYRGFSQSVIRNVLNFLQSETSLDVD